MSKQIIIPTLLVLSLIGSYMIYEKMTPSKIDQFQQWKLKFSFDWTQAQGPYRRMVFYRNLQKINEHNKSPLQTYKMKVTQFSVYTDAEFRLIFLSPKPFDPSWQKQDLQMPPTFAPIDWTEKGVISPIKNQGRCASGYAFSATGVLESFALMHNKSVSLSEQQFLDCSWAYENEGCKGGDNYQSLHFVKDHGLSTQDQYPYIAKNQPCKKKGGDFKITNVNYAQGCTTITTAIESRPVAVSVDASNWAHYASGIFNNCNKTVNHDLLLVGLTDQYWKIKNSWGQTWGQEGFIRLKTGNTCGICTFKSPWPV